MSHFQSQVDIEKYFLDNWTQTPIDINDLKFDYDNLDGWIMLKYLPSNSETYGIDGTASGRILNEGFFKVLCYGKYQKTSAQLANDVRLFLESKTLGDIYIDIAQTSQSTDLGNGYWETKIMFPIQNFT